MIKEFEHIIYAQLRSLGVVFHDDAGNRIAPGSGEENRVVNVLAINLAHNVPRFTVAVAEKGDCQTTVRPSCACPRPHHPSCPEYPAYLKDA